MPNGQAGGFLGKGYDPFALMAEYYGQRATAGLVVTEGTSPSPNGLGYPRIPGIFSQEQVDGWRKVVAAAHAGGAKFFIQLMHTGRIGHRCEGGIVGGEHGDFFAACPHVMQTRQADGFARR